MNEIFTWAKKAKKLTFLFKMDFEKAFNSINRAYSDSMMEQMGFTRKWRTWIHICLSTARASVFINKTPTEEFPILREVRQWDPFSPFLFIQAMEGLHVAIQDTNDMLLIQGLKLPHNGSIISHIFYADNAIFVGNWDKGNIKNLSRILKCFEISPELKVNFQKSRLFGICTFETELQDMAKILGCLKSCFPSRTLVYMLELMWWQKIIGNPLLINFNRNYQI